MHNPILKKIIAPVILSLCASASVAGTSASVSCSGNGSASAYSRSGDGVSHSSVSCTNSSRQDSVAPGGVAVSKSYLPNPYTSLVLSGAGNVEIRTGSENSVIVSGGGNYVESVEVNSSGGVLAIHWPDSGNSNLNVTVTSSALQVLEISGAGNTEVYGSFPHGLSVRKSGAGNINIGGQASYLALNLSGAGNTVARNLITDEVEVDASGAGNISVCAKESVSGSLSGAVHFNIYCNPFRESVNTQGASSIRYR